jgi:hypothetical protein
MTNKLVTIGAVPTYDVVDEDDMTSDSATSIPTQQSVKAYVDAEVAPKIEYVTGVIADASTAASSWCVSPIAGTITKIWTVMNTAITVADAAITFELGGTAITGGAITLAYDGAAAGDVDTCSPTALNTVTAGQAIEIITDGASTTASRIDVIFEITPSATSTTAWKKYITGAIANISAAASTWVVAPVAGTISKIWTVIDGAITVADAGVTFEIGGTAMTGGSITIANVASAAGTVDSCTPSALNVVTAGQAIEIVADGLSTDASAAVVLFEITPA